MPPTTESCPPQRLSSCDTEPALRFEAWRKQAHRWVDMLLVPPQAVLAPTLNTQLSQMALLLQSPTTLDANEYAALLKQARSMAMLMLHNLGKQFLSKPADTAANQHQGRYQAALRLMVCNLHQHELDATAIATGIGCSRTRLYAAFARHNTSVMQTLREIRLQRTKPLLKHPPQLHLGALSWRCGFTDQSSFSKLFKACFHVCPSEWHKHVWSRTNLSSSPR